MRIRLARSDEVTIYSVDYTIAFLSGRWKGMDVKKR